MTQEEIQRQPKDEPHAGSYPEAAGKDAARLSHRSALLCGLTDTCESKESTEAAQRQRPRQQPLHAQIFSKLLPIDLNRHVKRIWVARFVSTRIHSWQSPTSLSPPSALYCRIQ